MPNELLLCWDLFVFMQKYLLTTVTSSKDGRIDPLKIKRREEIRELARVEDVCVCSKSWNNYYYDNWIMIMK